MPIPVLSALFLIFIVWLQYEIRKNSKEAKQASDHFWEKEHRSNQIRRMDISHLDYLALDITQLPLSDKEDSTINSYRDTILSLKDKKLLNLAGLTNTELKNKYGAANITLLMEYDNNYTLLVSILQKWAERLYKEGFPSDAVLVLEFAISCNTDVSKSYKLLAELYKVQNSPEKIDYLINIIMMLDFFDKDKLIEDLKGIKIKLS